MTYVAWWDTSVEEVPDAVAAAKVFDTVTPGYAPHGGRGHALWFAPADSEDAVLRVDVDVDRIAEAGSRGDRRLHFRGKRRVTAELANRAARRRLLVPTRDPAARSSSE